MNKMCNFQLLLLVFEEKRIQPYKMDEEVDAVVLAEGVGVTLIKGLVVSVGSVT